MKKAKHKSRRHRSSVNAGRGSNTFIERLLYNKRKRERELLNARNGKRGVEKQSANKQ